MNTQINIIEVNKLRTELGNQLIHDGINFSVERGEVFGIAGGSGSGKTTLLRAMLMLLRPTSGSIQIFNREITDAHPHELLAVQRRWGVLFQQNALFSSLTVLENVMFPLKEFTRLDDATIRELALLTIALVGLPMEAVIKYPSQLSGGMQKRAALARAIVLAPEILFLDEPTAGLDPHSAAELGQLILKLRSTMGLTIVLVTHDLDMLWHVTDRVAFLGESKILCIDPIKKLVENPHPLIQEFFDGVWKQ